MDTWIGLLNFARGAAILHQVLGASHRFDAAGAMAKLKVQGVEPPSKLEKQNSIRFKANKQTNNHTNKAIQQKKPLVSIEFLVPPFRFFPIVHFFFPHFAIGFVCFLINWVGHILCVEKHTHKQQKIVSAKCTVQKR